MGIAYKAELKRLSQSDLPMSDSNLQPIRYKSMALSTKLSWLPKRSFNLDFLTKRFLNHNVILNGDDIMIKSNQNTKTTKYF